MLDKSNIKKFTEYLQGGVAEAMLINRGKLEQTIRDAIDLGKSRSIADKHSKKNDTFTMSPELFVSLGLVDYVPKGGIDLRLTPTFTLDGVIFKSHTPSSQKVYLTEVPYNSKIAEILRLQITPDIDVEISKSSEISNNLYEKINYYDLTYRELIKNYKSKLFEGAYSRFCRTNEFLNIERTTTSSNLNIITPSGASKKQKINKNFINTLLVCIANADVSFENRKITGIDTQYHQFAARGKMIAYQAQICRELIDKNISQENAYKEIFSIVVKKLFNINDKNIEQIFSGIVNRDERLDYEKIAKLLSPDIRQDVISWVVKQKIAAPNLINKKYIKSRERQIVTINKWIKESRRKIKKQELSKRQIALEEGAILKFKKLVSEAKTQIKKRVKDSQGWSLKNEIFIRPASLKSVNRILGKSISSHSFYNLVVLIERYRQRLRVLISSVKQPIIIRQRKATNLSLLAIIKQTEAPQQPQQPKFVYSEEFIINDHFNDYCKEVIALDELYDNAELEAEFCGDIALSIEEKIDRLTPVIGRYLDKSESKYLFSFNEKLIYKYTDYIFPYIKKYEIAYAKGEYAKGFSSAIEIVKPFINFCNTIKNENSGKLYEVTTGREISKIHNIPVRTVLNGIFNTDFFSDAETIFFHHSLIVASKNNELHSIFPTDIYSLLLLENVETKMSGLDTDGSQLKRFLEILNTVLQDESQKTFSNQRGSSFLDELEKSVDVKFITTKEELIDGNPVFHSIDIGSISQYEQEQFSEFIKNHYFIFPALIPEIKIEITQAKKRRQFPDTEKELLFFIDNIRDDYTMRTDFFITHEDLLLLGRTPRFYSSILSERAFTVIFNQKILNNEEVYTQFKSLIGEMNVELAKRYFQLRRKDVTEARILRKLFIQNSMALMQGSLSGDALIFMENIFNKRKQLN